MAKDQRSETNPGSTGKRIEAGARIRGAREDELRHQRRAKSPGGLVLVRQRGKAIFQVSASVPALLGTRYVRYIRVALFEALRRYLGSRVDASPSWGRSQLKPCKRFWQLAAKTARNIFCRR